MQQIVPGSFGVCQWIHFQDYAMLENALAYLRDLRVRRVRTGISWADWHRRGGVAWQSHVIRTFVARGIEVLPCLRHTPPSISSNGKCNGPPLRLQDFADFAGAVGQELGDCFTYVELWNEPNNTLKWDRDADPDWEQFSLMFSMAAAVLRQFFKKKVVLGGMSPIDHRWIQELERWGAYQHVDVLAAHAFPGQWNEPVESWRGWPDAVAHLRSMAAGREVWITETGCATWDTERSFDAMNTKQLYRLWECLDTCSADRVYWYSLMDLPDQYDELEWTVGGYREERERHMGLVTAAGEHKRAFYALKQYLTAV